MTLTQLRYLVALADHRHFGKAADACAISQPTLSAQLRKLETELQADLIERGRSVNLTPLGSAVVSRARGILSEADEITGIARQGEKPLAGPRRIGIIPTLCPYLLPWALPALKRDFPRLDLICREAMTGAVITAVKSRELDWGLIAEEPEDTALTAYRLFEEPFFAALSASHPLASHKQISRTAFCAEKVLVLGEGHCLRRQTRALCGPGARAGDDIQATGLETLRGLAAAGYGVTLLPAMACRGGGAGLALRPLRPAAGRAVYLIARRTDPRRTEAALFAGTVQKAAPDSVHVRKAVQNLP